MTTIRAFFQSVAWQKFRDVTLPDEEWVVGGVCGALGKATPFAAWMWRAFFCTAAIARGFGVGAYIILWISIPKGRA